MADVILITTSQLAEARRRYDSLDWTVPQMAAARNPRTARYARASAMAGILGSVMGYSVEESLALYVGNDAFQALALSVSDSIEAAKAEKAAQS